MLLTLTNLQADVCLLFWHHHPLQSVLLAEHLEQVSLVLSAFIDLALVKYLGSISTMGHIVKVGEHGQT